MSIAEDGAGDGVRGGRFKDCFGQVRMSVVNTQLFFIFIILLFYVVASAARNQEFHERAKEAPAPDLFLAVDCGDAVNNSGGGAATVRHDDGVRTWEEEGVLEVVEEYLVGLKFRGFK